MSDKNARERGYVDQKKYINEKCRVITMTLHKENDADIINHLDRQPNRTAYLKALIRKDIKR